MGSIARTSPGTSRGPRPGRPWLSTCGSWCISYRCRARRTRRRCRSAAAPRDRRPRPRARCRSACRPCVRRGRPPRRRPTASPRQAVGELSQLAGRPRPTPTVIAESPCQPSRMAPQSIEIRSPSCRTWPGARDGVDDLAVHRGADGRRVALVAQERRDRARLPDHLVGDLRRAPRWRRPARPRPAWRPARRPRRGRPARILLDLFGGLVLDIQLPAEHAARSSPVGPQGVDGPDGDVLDRAGGVDADQLALGAVVVDQRRGVPAVDAQPLGDGLGLVVVALVQLAAAPVADALVGRARRTRCARSCRSRGMCGGRRAAGPPRRRPRRARGRGRGRRRGRPAACPARPPAAPYGGSRRAGSRRRRPPRPAARGPC